MELRNDEVLIKGVAYGIPFLLRRIATSLEEINPAPPHNPIPTTPTRFSIHWTIAGRGEWYGFLVAHWDHQTRSHEYNTVILRITVDSWNGNFGSKCILFHKNHLVVCPTLDECKVATDNIVMSMVTTLHELCIKEDGNKVKTNWWE